MKKWLTILVLGGAVGATVGLSTRVAAQPEAGPTDAEFEAKVDARLREVLHIHLAARQSDAHTAARSR